MVPQNEYPFTAVNGKAFQREYNGHDIVVFLREHKNALVYVYKNGFRVYERSCKYAPVKEYFSIGEGIIDDLLKAALLELEKDIGSRKGYYEQKHRKAAIKALNTALLFGHVTIEKEEKEKLIRSFEFNLNKEINKL